MWRVDFLRGHGEKFLYFCLTVFKLLQGSLQNFHLQMKLATGMTFTKNKAKVKNFGFCRTEGQSVPTSYQVATYSPMTDTVCCLHWLRLVSLLCYFKKKLSGSGRMLWREITPFLKSNWAPWGNKCWRLLSVARRRGKEKSHGKKLHALSSATRNNVKSRTIVAPLASQHQYIGLRVTL